MLLHTLVASFFYKSEQHKPKTRWKNKLSPPLSEKSRSYSSRRGAARLPHSSPSPKQPPSTGWKKSKYNSPCGCTNVFEEEGKQHITTKKNPNNYGAKGDALDQETPFGMQSSSPHPRRNDPSYPAITFVDTNSRRGFAGEQAESSYAGVKLPNSTKIKYF